MMKLLEPYWTMVSSAVPWPYWDKIKDPWDHPILATAVAGEAQYVITDDKSDFPLGDVYKGIQFITPSVFLSDILLL